MQHLSLSINGAELEQVHHFKYLGVILDSVLSFDQHVDYRAGCSTGMCLVDFLDNIYQAWTGSVSLEWSPWT